MSRRDMLGLCSTGFGALALAGLTGPAGAAARPPHFRPRAKHVIFCYMSGGVSHVDTFDPKPRLQREHGKPMPMKIERTQFNQNGNIFGSPYAFKQYGESGIPVSSLFPHVATCVDDLAVIRSMTSTANEHAQGNYFFHTGFTFMGHPSAGAWVNYGLGSENDNLPGFVILQSGPANVPHGGVGLYGNGYLPAHHQGSILQSDKTNAVRNIQSLEAPQNQRRRLDFVNQLDRGFVQTIGGDADVEAAIENYETAFRMQAAVPELCDISGESEATKRLYGLDHPHAMTRHYARQCLLARRLVERGVRFVELSCLPQNEGDGQAANPWDQHGNLEEGHTNMALQVDQPIAGLIKDLKRRGLLDETLVIWAGEFGRTPFSQGSNGRDHNPYGFSIWLAGGGIRGGTVYGATDEYGYHVVENKCTVYDLWATVLHQLGVDHEQLTFRHGGRDLRLTDVHGHVLRDIIA
ncbi:MAG: DUF1501 domain-containing protein [Planctomycetes bacterium]|nr:DUF1501 domain-containing protein [Planctomycetota bacterium]